MKKVYTVLITFGIILAGIGVGGALYYQFSDQPTYLESRLFGEDYNQDFWTKENIAKYYASNRGRMSSRGHMRSRGHMGSRGHMRSRWNDNYNYRYENVLSYEEAYEEAERYLSQYDGLTLAEEYEEIKGFYIFQVIQGDEVQGLLSVDAYTKDIMEY